jgi:hypothetical protein
VRQVWETARGTGEGTCRLRAMGAVPTMAATTSERECMIGRSGRGRAPEQDSIESARMGADADCGSNNKLSFIPSTAPPRPRPAPSAGGPGGLMRRRRRTKLWVACGRRAGSRGGGGGGGCRA